MLEGEYYGYDGYAGAGRWRSMGWDDEGDGMDRESRGRVFLLGRVNVGKSTLFNRLCGWSVSPLDAGAQRSTSVRDGPACEDFGLFCLVDLPEYADGVLLEERMAYDWLGFGGRSDDGSLCVYILDGTTGLLASDYQWISRLRQTGIPLLVAMNKTDMIGDRSFVLCTETEARLATPVVPVSARNGTNVYDRLLPRMLDVCPGLAIPLGRGLRDFRRQAAHRVIKQTAMINGLASLEPVPGLDMPLQLSMLVRLISRIGAIYGYPIASAHRRDMLAAVAGGLASRYGIQQAAKLMPVLGWAASGLIGWSSTFLVGHATVLFFESNGVSGMAQNVGQLRHGLFVQIRQQPGRLRGWVRDVWRYLFHRRSYQQDTMILRYLRL